MLVKFDANAWSVATQTDGQVECNSPVSRFLFMRFNQQKTEADASSAGYQWRYLHDSLSLRTTVTFPVFGSKTCP